MRFSAKDASLEVIDKLKENGYTAYWVGGCVRDQLLGRQPKDYDVVTSAPPDCVQSIFPRTIAIGSAFGIIQAIIDTTPVEIATFREESDYQDGRHPSCIQLSTPEMDAQRRDFTINGLFFDPESRKIIDYVDGQKDIKQKVIRTIGDPFKRFSEDYLRMLRAVRFAHTLGFQIESNTAEAIQKLAPNIQHISMERIQQEFTRILTESLQAGNALKELDALNLLRFILPEVLTLKGQAQPPDYHPEGDVFTHVTNMLNAMEEPSVTLAYAVLLHDIGKPATAQIDTTGRIRFSCHDKMGAQITERILHRLKLPGTEIDDITHCVRNHMRFAEAINMRRSTLRRLIGAPTFDIELTLHRLDCICSNGFSDNYYYLLDMQKKFKEEKPLPEAWISGHDIMALDIPEGPDIGKWRKIAYDMQLEGVCESKESLLEKIKVMVDEARQ